MKHNMKRIVQCVMVTGIMKVKNVEYAKEMA